MHGISAQSAIAIRRERKRQEQQRKAKERRYSSGESPRMSVASADVLSHRRKPNVANKMMGTITMFHVGAIFLLIGLFLLTGALVPNETKKNMGDLIGTGVTCIIIGLFLIILNRIYGQKEEDELTQYVESRLARTRSGQRLYHESESAEALDQPVKAKGKVHKDKLNILNEVANNAVAHAKNKELRRSDISTSSSLERIPEEANATAPTLHPHSSTSEDRSDLYRVYDRNAV